MSLGPDVRVVERERGLRAGQSGRLEVHAAAHVGGHVSTYRLADQRSGFPIPRDSPAVQDATAYVKQQQDFDDGSSAGRVARSVVVVPSW